MTKKTQETFEESLARLEAIVQKLETGELPLEESMKLYEEGVRLTTLCGGRLKEARLKIEELKASGEEKEEQE